MSTPGPERQRRTKKRYLRRLESDSSVVIDYDVLITLLDVAPEAIESDFNRTVSTIISPSYMSAMNDAMNNVLGLPKSKSPKTTWREARGYRIY